MTAFPAGRLVVAGHGVPWREKTAISLRNTLGRVAAGPPL
jgi:hypothetical protein